MKKKYVRPAVEVIEVENDFEVLAGSRPDEHGGDWDPGHHGPHPHGPWDEPERREDGMWNIYDTNPAED